MGRPNYNRIIQIHGALPTGLQEDLGLKILRTDEGETQQVLEPALPGKVKAEEAPDYSILVDAVSGKKLLEMTWPEIKAKAVKDEIFKNGMKKKDILDEYLKRSE